MNIDEPQPRLTFHSEILNLPNNVYLNGYWQSEKYFNNIEDIIRKEITFKKEPNDLNKKHIDKIISANSVSVHIRRGDYMNNPSTKKKLGLCSDEYYFKAINYIAENIENIHFFIFSDEPQIAKNLLEKIKHPKTFIYNNNDNGSEDLRLMSYCKHNIIANSSFSWWGAWLNKNNNKIVTAPKHWFNYNPNPNDLILDTWIRI